MLVEERVLGALATVISVKRLPEPLVILAAGVHGIVVQEWATSHDWTEERRASLPPLVTERLRTIRTPIELDIYLDRDDSRRGQLESDVLEKLTLARPDTVVRTPLDSVKEVQEGQRDDAYGRLVIRAGEGVRETRSTSRREIVTLIFESAGTPQPDWNQPSYPGFPVVIDGPRRRLLVALAYAGLPLAFLAVGLRLSQRRTSR